MEERNDYIEIFESYLGDSLSPEARRVFEAKLIANPDFKEEFEIYQRISSGFQDIKSDKIRKKLQLIESEIDHKQNNSKVFPIRFWLSAAAIILLLIVSYRYLSLEKSNNTFQTSFIPFEEGLPVLMSSDSRKDFDDAMSVFKAGEYEAALVDFTKLNNLNSGNDTVIYFLANSLLRSEHYKEAAPLFSKLANNSTTSFQQKSEFYHAICLWAMGNPDSAKSAFIKISKSSNHPFFKETEQLNTLIDPDN